MLNSCHKSDDHNSCISHQGEPSFRERRGRDLRRCRVSPISSLRKGAGRTFVSLNVRNYRLFISGQLVSVTGTWMQTVALGWLLLRITDSGFAVGLNLALQFLPMLLFGMLGGVLADRFDKRRLLVSTQSAMAVLALILFTVTQLDVVTPLMIYGITLLLGFTTVVDNPTRQAFVTELVGGDLVSNAVSLNSAVFNASRIIGPAIAGVAIGTIGLSWVFLVNAFTFLAVIVALLAMDPERLHTGTPQPRARGQVREGLRYVWSTPRLRYTLLLVAVFSTFGLNFSVVLPLFARFTFGRGAAAYGLLTSMMASGALAGALVSAARRRPTRRILIASAGSFGLFATMAALSPTFPMFAVLLVGVGASSITFIAAANSTLQLGSAPAMRGRVMALYGLVFLGSTPFGGPLIGWISETWSPRLGLGLGGTMTAAAAAAALVFIKRDRIEERLRDIVPLRRRVPLVPPDGSADGIPAPSPREETRRAG